MQIKMGSLKSSKKRSKKDTLGGYMGRRGLKKAKRGFLGVKGRYTPKGLKKA